ncbi:hypothetical protein BABINDRAFT_163193 [Babjeviella inositovora NRRL Y-12698]|uniref:Exoribonuclease phosphorolytic domain-containing protein n=1 Tax=Babjeviella inositovora NRRL Y-12698 TaxID=984486 RepID=A0A1E3QJC7_9ASCO|nr:uncharacterized protein BABINDRAFT_163193 [Babjeviella inositovora NRRL Y-12698]ODQ77806.1 hypothetical protein BABINDRAFT_163193 [Babjeviella inositovora NRRL Y-12698]
MSSVNTAQTSLLNRVDGSSQVESGATKVLCSVTGPIEAKSRQELPTAAALEIIVRPAVGVSSTREKLLEDKLRSVLSSVIVRHIYPRQLIQIVVQVLQAGESAEYTVRETAAAINASFLALIDANVALHTSFSATCLAAPTAQSPKEKFILSPTADELKKALSNHVVAYSIVNGESEKLLLSDSNGSFTEAQLYHVLDVGAAECELIHKKFRQTAKEKIEHDYVWQC